MCDINSLKISENMVCDIGKTHAGENVRIFNWDIGDRGASEKSNSSILSQLTNINI